MTPQATPTLAGEVEHVIPHGALICKLSPVARQRTPVRVRRHTRFSPFPARQYNPHSCRSGMTSRASGIERRMNRRPDVLLVMPPTRRGLLPESLDLDGEQRRVQDSARFIGAFALVPNLGRKIVPPPKLITVDPGLREQLYGNAVGETRHAFEIGLV